MKKTYISNDKDDQGYLVSLGDMLSGLIFIFIIILIVFAMRMEVEKSRYDNQTKLLTDAKEVRQELLENLKERLHQLGVRVEIDIENGLLRLPEEILFVSGSAEFVPGGADKLRTLSIVLGDLLPCYARLMDGTTLVAKCSENSRSGRLDAILIEGHTDNRPLSSSRYDNWNLSADRSIRTYKFITQSNNILDLFVNNDGRKIFGVSAYAATRPAIYHDVATDEPRNRRIDLRFILAQPKIESPEQKRDSLELDPKSSSVLQTSEISHNSTSKGL